MSSSQNNKLTTSSSFSRVRTRTPSFQKDKIFEITGREKKHINIHESKEIKKFSNIKLKNFPNSNRVLIPEKNEKIYHRPSSSSKFNSESSQFAYISNVDYNIRQKPLSPTSRESYDFKQSQKNNVMTLKRGNKQTPFGNYSTTTQIVNLPGGVKRNYNDIKDDTKRVFVDYERGAQTQRESYRAKIMNDYNTNISCLPGCPYNEKKCYKEDIPLRKQFNNRSQSDIFNLKEEKQPSSNKGKLLFNMSHKRIFPEKNNTGSQIKTNGIKRIYNNQSNFSFV